MPGGPESRVRVWVRRYRIASTWLGFRGAIGRCSSNLGAGVDCSKVKCSSEGWCCLRDFLAMGGYNVIR